MREPTTDAEARGENLPLREPKGVLWRGRQWCVTDYGLETRGRPYAYYLGAGQLSGERQAPDGPVFDFIVHVMEKNWLDVDDFLTAALVALSLHGIPTTAEKARRTVREALREREALYGQKPGLLPASERPSIGTMSEMAKYQSAPAWYGSSVFGEALGGLPPDPSFNTEASEEEDKGEGG